jgi:hypothetical protein
MTREEELKRLNHLIHQYESVCRTTNSEEQRERVLKQLKDLRRNRQQILDVFVIGTEEPQQAGPRSGALVEFKHLHRLLDAESRRPKEERLQRLAANDAEPTLAREEVFNLMVYARFFQSEFLPFLTEKRLKLDSKFSQDRDGFYRRFKELERKLDDFRDEAARLIEGIVNREMALEMRERIIKLKRQIKLDAAKLFRTVQSFCEELIDDAEGSGVKCLNGRDEITFDDIEGRHLLEGLWVTDALAVLAGLASEVVAYLKGQQIDR